MELNHLPIIDWELGTKLAGNKKHVAEELMDLLIKTLEKDFHGIKQLYDEHNDFELIKNVHRLHGAVCYLGLPRLKSILRQLEADLKNSINTNLPALMTQLENEVSLILKHCPSYRPN